MLLRIKSMNHGDDSASHPNKSRPAPPKSGRPAPPKSGRPEPPKLGRPAPPKSGRPAPQKMKTYQFLIKIWIHKVLKTQQWPGLKI